MAERREKGWPGSYQEEHTARERATSGTARHEFGARIGPPARASPRVRYGSYHSPARAT